MGYSLPFTVSNSKAAALGFPRQLGSVDTSDPLTEEELQPPLRSRKLCGVVVFGEHVEILTFRPLPVKAKWTSLERVDMLAFTVNPMFGIPPISRD